MKRATKNKSEDAYLKAFGKHLEEMIKNKGYESVYDFWINRAGDDLSRAALNYLVAGQADVKLLTLRKLAKLLKVEPKDILDFRQ